MAKPKFLTSPPDISTMPPGIPYIVGNEAAERFSFYGMKTILFIFMTQHLLDASGQADVMSDAEAKTWVHSFVGAAYFFPIIGAIFADWRWGKYNTILSLSLLYCVGHGILAAMDFPQALGIDQRTLLFWGLACIAVGAGGIKSCVSAHVGDQFGKANQHLLPIVFAWFYFSINFGSTFSTLLTPWLAENPRFGYGWAFGVPGVVMALATFVFWLGRNKFVHVPPARKTFFKDTFSPEGLRAIGHLIPLYLFVAMFWALFDQTASAWVQQATNMNRQLIDLTSLGIPLSWTTPSPSQLQAANPILVMILIPIFSYGIYPLLGKYFTVTPLRKVGIGLFVMLPAFLLPGLVETWIEAGETPSIWWQVLAYVVITAAEVMISITVLEFSYTQAPLNIKSFIMGVFWLSVAIGNEFTALVNLYIEKSQKAGSPILQGANYYWFFSGCMAITAVLFVIWSQFYRGRTYIRDSESATAH